MAKKADAKRAQQKHRKEQKRKRTLSVRTATANRTVLDRWKPRAHGIEGLARLLGIDTHDASVVAERVATQRKDARVTWIPSRVHALSTEALLAELAARGVPLDEGVFVSLAAGYESARRLAAENWHTEATGGVHDRDLAGQAAEELWARWLPGAPADEVLRDRWRDAQDLVYEHPAICVADLLGILDAVGVDRVVRAVGDPLALLGTLALADEIASPDDIRTSRVDGVLRTWRAAQSVGTAAWTDATILVAARMPLEERVTEVLDRLAQDPTNEKLLSYANDELSYADERGPLDSQLDAAYEAAIAASDGALRDRLQAALAVLREEPPDDGWGDDDFDDDIASAP